MKPKPKAVSKQPQQCIVGTAGHIEHGKSALVEALTGVKTAQLPEEGTTTDLGFAPLHDKGNDKKGPLTLGFIDVPGHERFVKNMIAGAQGIDMVLLVIAADSGVQPQTTEHLEICRLLGIQHGVVALTKADKLPPESRDRILNTRMQEIQRLVQGTFLEKAPVVPVGLNSGISELKTTLQTVARQSLNDARNARQRRPFRLYVDRVFTKKGFGTIVTGSSLNGHCKVGDKLQLFAANNKIDVVVRKLESFLQELPQAIAGMRLALNLQHPDLDGTEVTQGTALSIPEHLVASDELLVHIDIANKLPAPVTHNIWVSVHWGTSETRGRLLLRSFGKDQLHPGTESFALLKLDAPVFVKYGDRIILRGETPSLTLAGGRVLVPIGEATPYGGSRWSTADLQPLIDGLRAGTDAAATAACKQLLDRAGRSGVTLRQLSTFIDSTLAETALQLEEELLQGRILSTTSDKGETESPVVLQQHFETVLAAILHLLKEHQTANPDNMVMNQEVLRTKLGKSLSTAVFRRGIETLKNDKQIAASSDGGLYLPDAPAPKKSKKSREAEATKSAPAAEPAASGNLTDKMAALIKKAGLTPPNTAELAILLSIPRPIAGGFVQSLLRNGRAVRLPGDFYLDSEMVQPLCQKLLRHFELSQKLTLGEFKTLLGLSRKYVVPLLEYLDEQKYTLRLPDDTRKPGPNLAMAKG